MMTSTRVHARALYVFVALLATVGTVGTAAADQAPTQPQVAQVRVVRDRATIWRRDARIPATTVRKGATLDAVARQGDWYVVVIPSSPEPGDLGLIAATVVELVPGSPVPPDRTPPPAPGSTAAGARPGTARPVPNVALLGFGQVGVGRWLAHNTFDAITGSSFFPMFGGGAEVRFRSGLFAAGSAEYFQKTGQRVFVDNGTAYRLGIADKIRIIPIEGRIGYRRVAGGFAWYVAGGAGTYLYRERSDFSTGSDNVDEAFASYHALAGIDVPVSGTGVITAFEVEYTTVPSALGSRGASAAFGERNLGGVQARIRVLVGK